MRKMLWAAAGAVTVAVGVAACSEAERVTPPPVVVATPLATPTPSPTPEPTPDPEATPASCPMLTRWSSGIHNITDPLSKPASTAYVGGHVLVDSTPLFGGQACNSEHSNCGGRLCEPEEGGEWWLLEGGSPSQVRGGGYQFRIGPLRGGYHRWRVCPRTGTKDPQGVPLVVRDNSCTEGLFFVYPHPVSE
jgi:hypothetical protein